MPGLLVACYIVGVSGQAIAQSAPNPSDANLLLLEVRLERHVLSDSLTAYQKGRHVLVPLGEMAKLLTIAIRTQPQDGTASGFVLREERTFHLNAGERIAVVADKKESVDAGLLEVHADDIYVASSLFARWLPVDLEIDLSALSLRVKPREPLPLQQRLERERRGASARAGLYEDPGYPLRESSYRLLDTPSIDQTFALNMRRSRGQSASEGSYTAFLAGDLLGMESALFLSAGGESPGQRFRATLGRNDPGGRLLGPLGARSYAFGSIAVPGFANVARTSPTGNGLRVSNRPLIQPLSFDRHTLQGDLPPGWDVELYFNDALIGFQRSRPDGKYVFADLPLVYGLNEFRLVFHGPLGQLRVERQSFIFEESLVSPGQFLYHFAQHRDLAGNPRAAAQFDLGLARRLSASAGLSQLTVGGVERRYSNLGLRAAWQSLFLHGDLVHSEDGGSLAELGGRLRLGGFTLGLRRAAPREFTSEFFLPSTDPVRTRDALRLDGIVPLGGLLRLPLALELRRDRLQSGLENTEATGRISAYFHGTAVTNQLRWQSIGGIASADGGLQMSRRVGAVGLRGLLNYGLRPENELTGVALSGDRSLGQGYLLNLGVNRELRMRETRYTAGLNKTLGSYGLGITATYSTLGEVALLGQLFVAMGREPREPRWVPDALPMADTGAISARVFVDKNMNGVMDGNDEPVKGAAFLVNGGRHPARTDAAGIAYLSRLPVRQYVDVGIDSASLEDPQWVAQPKGLRLVPRPGQAATLEFPVILTSEIDGTVHVREKGRFRPLAGITLELLDSQRNVVNRAQTASDGFYVVQFVPPGNYLLRISPEELKKLGFSDTGTRVLQVKPTGEFLNGVDMIALDDRVTVVAAPPARAQAKPAVIAGTVYVRERGLFRETGGIVLELLDRRRRVVSRAQTASDGAYRFEAVPPGSYLLRASPEQLKKLRLSDTGMRIIEIKATRESVYGVDLLLLDDRVSTGSAAPPGTVARKHAQGSWSAASASVLPPSSGRSR